MILYTHNKDFHYHNPLSIGLEVDPSYIKYRGIVAPAYGQIGGAEEIIITVPIPILSIFDMRSKRLVYSLLK